MGGMGLYDVLLEMRVGTINILIVLCCCGMPERGYSSKPSSTLRCNVNNSHGQQPACYNGHHPRLIMPIALDA